MKKYFIILIMLSFGITSPGQDLDSLKPGEKYSISTSDYDNDSVEMADLMRSNGKIYVVVGVITIIFLGLIIYMINTDRKLSKIEKEVFNEKG